MSSPRISVVIPTCNRNDLLALCLDCLAPGTQTLPATDYEVIVTDDGATNNAQQMMSENYPWAIWTQGPRRGPAANRNHGASEARGEWLAFTDDDCLPSPQWLIAFYENMGADVTAMEGKTVSAESYGLFFTAPVNLTGDCFWSCNICLKKAIFLEIQGFDTGFPSAHLEDVDFYWRLKQAEYHSLFVPDSVILHPPRKLRSIYKQAADHESAFYMSRKHSLPLKRFGLNPTMYLKHQARKILFNSQSVSEGARFLLTRTLIEAVLLTFYAPRWMIKYNVRKGTMR